MFYGRQTGETSWDPPSNTVTSVMIENPMGNTVNTGPPLPAEGLPEGWSMDQWTYYGEAYLNGEFD